MVLINPNSGPGRANQIFRKQVVPILGESEVAYEAIITTHAKHAEKLVREIDLNTYRGIVIVSGDGLVYEVIFVYCNKVLLRSFILYLVVNLMNAPTVICAQTNFNN